MFLIDKNLNPSVETKPDPRSIEGLIAWLETMPAGEEYDWYSIYDCLICQYMKHHGHAEPVHTNYPGEPQQPCNLQQYLGKEIYVQVGYPSPWTFGAALDRARAYQAKVHT